MHRGGPKHRAETTQPSHRHTHPAPPQTPRILLASWMSFCMIVTLLACMAQRFVSSNRCIKNASAASCNARIACDCHLMPSSRGRTVSAISRTSRAKGSFRSKRSVLFWYFLISLKATVPGLYLLFFPCGTGSPGCTSLCLPALLLLPAAPPVEALGFLTAPAPDTLAFGGIS